jgi:hypothetical protein
LETAYNLVRSKTGAKHERQEEFYNCKVHGTPFFSGDHVWLFSPVVPRGKPKKLCHPWIGPWVVVSIILYGKIENWNCTRKTSKNRGTLIELQVGKQMTE